jgi:hypothetical protein
MARCCLLVLAVGGPVLTVAGLMSVLRAVEQDPVYSVAYGGTGKLNHSRAKIKVVRQSAPAGASGPAGRAATAPLLPTTTFRVTCAHVCDSYRATSHGAPSGRRWMSMTGAAWVCIRGSGPVVRYATATVPPVQAYRQVRPAHTSRSSPCDGRHAPISRVQYFSVPRRCGACYSELERLNSTASQIAGQSAGLLVTLFQQA